MQMGSSQNLNATSDLEGQEANLNQGRWLSVFSLSLFSIVCVCLLSVLAPEWAKATFEGARRWTVIHLDWWLLLSANILLILSAFLMLSPLGKKRLGKGEKEYSDLAWFSMILFTGFGLTLVFWAVTEPMAFYTDWWGVPFNHEAKSDAAAQLGLAASVYHWGLHYWAIYAITGIAIGYACYHKSLPLTLSAAFHPLIKHTQSYSARFIDAMALVATLLGVATTLGLGARQAGKTLEHLYGIPNTLLSQSIIILVTGLVLFMVMQKGLNRGIKPMSQLNLGLVVLFLVLFLLFSHSENAINLVTDATLTYVQHFIAFSQWDGRSDLKFFHGWTVFYWLWWFSWAPFIGLFLAKISKGRSIRECVVAMVLLPTLFIYVWFMVFGGISLEQVIQGNSAILEPRLSPSTALFNLLEPLSWGQGLAGLAVFLVLLCFVTTADSSVYVITKLSQFKSTNEKQTGLTQFWVFILVGVGLAVLIFGGKKALESVQSVSLVLGLVMSLLLLLSSVCLLWSLKQDKR